MSTPYKTLEFAALSRRARRHAEDVRADRDAVADARREALEALTASPAGAARHVAIRI